MNVAIGEENKQYRNFHKHVKSCFAAQTLTANRLRGYDKKQGAAAAGLRDSKQQKENDVELVSEPLGQDQSPI